MSQEPQRQVVPEAAFTVVGISARTSNAAEAKPGGEIPKLWARVMGEHVLRNIPHKSSADLVVVYADYENGKEAEYTYTLGTKVHSVDVVPEGMVLQNVLAGEYEIFKTQDASTKALLDLWGRIWALEDQGNLKRAYRTDYELHHQPKADAEIIPLEIYIGIGT